MKKTITALLLTALAAAPSLAGLKFVATPDSLSYSSGPGTTGVMTLSVLVDGGSMVNFVTGPVNSATPISLSFVARGPGQGPAPAITGTFATLPWSPILTPSDGPNTFSAFTFAAQTADTVTGGANFSVPDPTTNGLFDLVASDFALTDLDPTTPNVLGSGIIGTINVVGIPEPSSFLFLGLVGSGVVGAQFWRRRKHNDDEPVEAEDEVVVV